MAAMTKALTHDAFHPAPVDSPPSALLWDRKPQVRWLTTITPSENYKAEINRCCRLGKQSLKIFWSL